MIANMPVVRRRATLAPEPIALHSHALDNLRFIRDTMERAGHFTAVPGWGMVAMGLSALGAAKLANLQTSLEGWLWIWLAEAVVALGIGGLAVQRKARSTQTPIATDAARRFLLSFGPSLLAGAILTAQLLRSGVPSMLPGTWLCLYGTGVVTGGAFSARVVPAMGLAFIGLGCATFYLPPAWADLALAVAFGGVHILFGVVIARRYGG